MCHWIYPCKKRRMASEYRLIKFFEIFRKGCFQGDFFFGSCGTYDYRNRLRFRTGKRSGWHQRSHLYGEFVFRPRHEINLRHRRGSRAYRWRESLPVLPKAKCGRRLRPEGAKRHAFGVPFPLFFCCFLFILACLFLYIMYIPVALYEL